MGGLTMQELMILAKLRNLNGYENISRQQLDLQLNLLQDLKNISITSNNNQCIP